MLMPAVDRFVYPCLVLRPGLNQAPTNDGNILSRAKVADQAPIVLCLNIWGFVRMQSNKVQHLNTRKTDL